MVRPFIQILPSLYGFAHSLRTTPNSHINSHSEFLQMDSCSGDSAMNEIEDEIALPINEIDQNAAASSSINEVTQNVLMEATSAGAADTIVFLIENNKVDLDWEIDGTF